MPCNLYGPNDNFDRLNSHVLPALIRKFHEAKVEGRDVVVVWGTGTPLREFLHVDDLARGVVFCLDHYNEYDHINCGAGSEISIAELAGTVQRAVGFEGRLVFDPTKPDGTPRKLMDSGRIRALGWKPEILLDEGLRDAYQWFLEECRTQRTPGGVIGHRARTYVRSVLFLRDAPAAATQEGDVRAARLPDFCVVARVMKLGYKASLSPIGKMQDGAALNCRETSKYKKALTIERLFIRTGAAFRKTRAARLTSGDAG